MGKMSRVVELNVMLSITMLILATSAIQIDASVLKAELKDAVDCSGTMQSLMSCLPAVEGDEPPLPSKECCSAIQVVNADCLCNMLSEGSDDLLGMNVAAALHLPRECGRVVPKGFACAGYTVPSV